MKKVSILCLALLASVVLFADRWVRVTDASTLQEGDQVVFANSEHGHTASKSFTSSSSSIKALGYAVATFSENQITELDDNTAVFSLVKSGDNWKFAIQGATGTFYLGATAVRKLAWSSGTQTWTITSDAEGVITVASTNSSYGTIQYNYNSGDARFTVYTTSQTPVELYRFVESQKFSVTYQGYPYNKVACEEPVYDEGTQVVLSEGRPTNGEFEFLGWEFDGQMYQPGETIVVPDKDVVLVAKWNDPQAIDETPMHVDAKKIIRDGQLVIVKENVMFNVLGERIQ